MKHDFTEKVGFVELSDKVVVSDPSYDRGTWCMATDVPVKPGTYEAYISKINDKDFGTRVSSIVLIHSEFADFIDENWVQYDCTIGVDSGQCGVFDDTVYPQIGVITLKAFIGAVFGGLGSVPGAVIGSFLLGVIETLVAGYISSQFRDLVAFSLLILVLVFRPSGLMGKINEDKA